MAFYCNGKKGVCDTYPVCKRSCKYFDNSGGKRITTNADRIRAMSDEEMADIMSMHTATGACNDWGIPHEKCGGNCRECIIDWLQQPAEV